MVGAGDSAVGQRATMNIAAIIIGIDGWQRYTMPLVKSIQQHEPDCEILVVDNGSEERYPWTECQIMRTERLCYSEAINRGHRWINEILEFDADWYIVLSNDVLCTGPFAHILEQLDGNDVVG